MTVDGLTSLTTEQLKKLLSYLHQGKLSLPLDAHSIACADSTWTPRLMAALRGLDEAGVRAVLVCVLAERLANEDAQA